VADVSTAIFVVLFMVGASTMLVRAAWLHWTDSDRAPAMTTNRYSSDPSVIRGHERGVVPFAG
jgi:hypothetical protein